MSEWSIVQSWNGCVRKRTSGSNPDLCAIKTVPLWDFLFAEIERARCTQLLSAITRTYIHRFFECQPSRSEIYSLSLKLRIGYLQKVSPMLYSNNRFRSVFMSSDNSKIIRHTNISVIENFILIGSFRLLYLVRIYNN